ncbi:MAG: hypothetical protein M3014_04785 [Chloroflexota bacterium]|nr:hypothetical protein [Chloroflexota bacterium]
MSRMNFTVKQLSWSALTFLMLAVGMVGTSRVAAQRSAVGAAQGPVFADHAFQAVWARSDMPVVDQRVARSWTWGPEPFYTSYEPYIEGPGGQHLVTYLDKSRMEINNPSGDRTAEWYVTNGLLVVDMAAGHVQTGNNTFAPSVPANLPVAGDTGSPNAPTYATLAKVASLNGNNRAPNRTGQNVREGLGRDGNVGDVSNLAGFARYVIYDPTLGHNIPDVFWNYLNSHGPIYENGHYADGLIMDWLFAMGYPITEPYWINIKVGNSDRWVLMQAFQRRILTYSPYNAEGWKVEMGNVGRAYYDWRYRGLGTAPTPTAAPPVATPSPVAAAIGIDPSQGDTNTPVTVRGTGFPAGASITINVERPDANYVRSVGKTTASGDGTFTITVGVPAGAAHWQNVQITASGGGKKAIQNFHLVYNPSMTVSPSRQVVSGGILTVQGTGWPADSTVVVGLDFSSGRLENVAHTQADDRGVISTTINIGPRRAGNEFYVVATGDFNLRARTANPIMVVAQLSSLWRRGLVLGGTAR